MSNKLNSEIDPNQEMVYQIRIKGHLGREWADWFEGLTITALDNDETLLTGPVVDQAALHGLLRKVRDLGIPLLLVVRVRPDPADALDVKQEMNDQSKRTWRKRMKAQPGARIEPRDPQQRTGDSKVMERIAGASPRHLARIAGGLYLIIIVGGFFAIGFVPAAIVVPGDAAATAHNILAHELLYRLGLAAHIIILMCNVPLAVIFYDLFKVVSRRLSLLVVFFTLVGPPLKAPIYSISSRLSYFWGAGTT